MIETILLITIDISTNSISIKKKISNETEIIKLKVSNHSFQPTIEFDKNEINLGIFYEGENVISDFFHILLKDPSMFIRYRFDYQNVSYKLTAEQLLAIFFYQFKRTIHKTHKIIETQISIDTDSINLQLIKACHFIGLTSIKINGKSQRKCSFQQSEIDVVKEIIEKQEKYEIFKQQIERIRLQQQETFESEEEKQLFTMDINEYYSETKMNELENTFSFQKRSQYQLFHLEKHCLQIASSYFESIDDFISLEMVSKRMTGNMESFNFNPIPLNKYTMKFFPNLQCFHVYSESDYLIKNKQIKSCKIAYKIPYHIVLAINSKYSNTKIKYNSIMYTTEDRDIQRGKKNISKQIPFDFELPNLIKEIEMKCFYQYDGLKSITLPTTITKLGNECFAYCLGLKEIDIPESVVDFGFHCFYGCTKLTRLSIPLNKTRILQSNKIFINKNKQLQQLYLPNSIKNINGKEVFHSSEYIIPQNITSIGKYCFEDCLELLQLTLPTTIIEINEDMFIGCKKLTKLDIPSTIQFIPFTIFQHLDKLKSLSISNDWKQEGYRLFKDIDGCLYSIQLPTTIRQINRKQIIALKELTSYTIPSTVTKLNSYCFAHCINLKEIKGIKQIEEVGRGCFYNCPDLDKESIPEYTIEMKRHLDLSDYQIQMIQHWTGFKIEETLFDSYVDNWAMNTSCFTQRILGKSHLLFLIDDENGEKFGYYLHTQARDNKMENGIGSLIPTDKHSFHFNLETRGRLEDAVKFEIMDVKNGGIILYHPNSPELIQIGEIRLFKQVQKDQSFYNQTIIMFNYKLMKNALNGISPQKNGKTYFIPKRIVVLHLD